MNQPMYWSLRRELWENRALYAAPLIVAVVELCGFAISTIGMPERRRATLMLAPAQQRAAIIQPYDAAAGILIVIAFIIGFFYSLDALYGERRDRSILFWKSLPVSDTTTVLSKAGVPLVVLPLIVFPIIVATQFAMMLWSTVVLLPSGLAFSTWTHVDFMTRAFALLYALIALALWHAPVYGWLLMVSAWARRVPVLWAVLPFILLSILERIAFGTTYVPSLLRYRLIGGIGEAFAINPHGSGHAPPPTPLNFLTTPGLWLGLMFAALFLIAAVRLRRYREPI